MSTLRIHERDAIHFVTNRTEHQLFLLLPTKAINELVLQWLARAREEKGRGIEIFAFVVLSNHFHLLLRDTKGELAAFMDYFQGCLATAVNRHWGREGTFWQRRYDDEVVKGNAEFWNRYAYLLANPVKSGLVGVPSHWRGVSSLSYLLDHKPVEVKGLRWGDYNEARRWNKNVKKEDFECTWSFALTPPPEFEKKPHAKLVAFVTELLQSACAKYRADRMWKAPLGMQRVLQQSPFSSPKKVEKKPRQRFFCLDKGRLDALENAYRAFVDSYRGCMDAWRKCRRHPGRAAQIEWPRWSYPPGYLVPVGF